MSVHTAHTRLRCGHLYLEVSAIMASDTAMQQTLDELVAERDELNLAIAVLAKRLGVPVPPGGGAGLASPNGAGRGSPGVGGDPLASTTEGEYFGFTSTKAAGELLQKY